MKFLVSFLALGMIAFGQAPGPGRSNSPDATTRLLIEFFKGDTNRDGRISEWKLPPKPRHHRRELFGNFAWQLRQDCVRIKHFKM